MIEIVCNDSQEYQQRRSSDAQTDPAFSSIVPCILYLRTNSDNISNTTIQQLESACNIEFTVCETMSAFLNRLADSTKIRPRIMLIDHSILSTNLLIIPELVSMVSTLASFMGSECIDARISVIVDKTCSPSFLKELHKTPISGIVPSTASLGFDVLLSAIVAQLNGKYYWPTSVIELLTGKDNTNCRKGIQLTPRQSEVMELICTRGLCNKKIASILKISESTVKVHVGLILKSYGVQNRTQLVLAANNSKSTLLLKLL